MKNPVHRKTITKITNLNQAATIGGLNVEDLINKLRKVVGQSSIENLETEQGNYNIEKPGWYSDGAVVNTIDIREMLHAGEQPVHEALSAARKLKEGEILKIIAPFIPAPLIDKTLSLNYDHWIYKRTFDEFWVYFSNFKTVK